MDMLRTLTKSAAALILSAGMGMASGASSGHIENIRFSFDGPFGTYDQSQLLRGLKIYTEVCAGCHGLQYVPLRTLDGVGLSGDEITAYSAANFEVFDAELDDTRPAKPTDNFPANTGVGAPDLSMMAKARAGFHGPYGLGINQLFKGMGGPEYIAALLQGYTGHEKEEAGAVLYENTAFPGGWISMAPPLEDGSVEFDNGHANDLHHLSEDTAAFLMWAAEPKLDDRKAVGFRSVILLILLSALLYLTNKRIWAPVKGKKSA